MAPCSIASHARSRPTRPIGRAAASAPIGAAGPSRTCAGMRLPATIAENAPWGPPPGSGPTYGKSGPRASVAADALGAIGPRGRVGVRSGRARISSSSGSVR